MCGIAGIYNKSGLPPGTATIRQMSRAIAHRGPDEEGFHADGLVRLASRRLSIIDLAAGAQPIYSPDKTCCIIFNGEIYNYASLRTMLAEQGIVFQTKTDTEVVLHAYRRWGVDALSRLNGMFALCVWDAENRSLFLARDRFGIKPLYTAELPDGTLVFASEIKAILQHPSVPKKARLRSIDSMLTYGFCLAPHTFFDGITQVLPGHYLHFTPRSRVYRQYWDIDLSAPELKADEETAAAMLHEHLFRSVTAGLVSDVPVASYLSGGIDSSAVTGMYAARSSDRIQTLTITFPDACYDESAYARDVSERFHTRHHEFSCSLLPPEIRNLIYHQENPLVSLLCLPLYLLSKEARHLGIKVVLCGDGADEVLGGYDYFKLLKAMRFIDTAGGTTSFRTAIIKKLFPSVSTDRDAQARYVQLSNMRSRFPNAHPANPYGFQAFQLKDQLFDPGMEDRLSKKPLDTPFFFPADSLSQRSFIDQALYIETKLRLLNLTLPLSDKMSMANSVELRPLFLDHEFVDFLFTLPHHYKIRGLSEKHIFKKSMRGFLPDSICRRRKQPLQPPASWFIAAAGEMLRDLLAPESIRKTGYFNPAFVSHILSEYDNGAPIDYSGVIVVVFFMQLWHDIFFGIR